MGIIYLPLAKLISSSSPMIDAISICRRIGLTNAQLCWQHGLRCWTLAMHLQILHHALQLIIPLVWLNL